jgi:hypothetical protein
MTRSGYAALLACCLFTTTEGRGDTLEAVRPLPGYICMDLNLSEAQMMDPSVHVPIMTEPSANSKPLGYAMATVIVASPPHEAGGYLEVLHLDGKRGWIASRYVRPWRNPGTSGHKCIPSLMSNGRIGFAYR